MDHPHVPDESVTIGSGVGAQVLTRAVQWNSESRVLVNGNCTVSFR